MKIKKTESPTQHFIFISFNYYETSWNNLCDRIFYLTDVKLAYRPGTYKIVWVVSAVSKFCSKFWRDCYDSKSDETSIYFKNLENYLFRELEVIQ